MFEYYVLFFLTDSSHMGEKSEDCGTIESGCFKHQVCHHAGSAIIINIIHSSLLPFKSLKVKKLLDEH